MAFNGSGVFNLVSGNPVVTGTTISSTWANNTLSDVATGLSNCVTRDGQSPATANLPMGGYKLTGLALATATGDALSYGRAATVTDLTSSGTLTLSGGTANGIAYLNASKQVTSGSALTFDGTNMGVGAGLTAGYGILQVRGGFAYVNEDGANTHQLYLRSNYGTAGPAIQVGGTDPLLFVLNSSEQMRLTSAGLGIGTSSPNYSLTSYKGGAVANYLQVASGATGAGAANGLLLGVDSSGNSVINAQGAVNLYTYVAGVLRTTIDSSGNLGLGVTPSVWRSDFKAQQIGSYGSALWGRTGSIQVGLITNGYLNSSGSWIYSTSGGATSYITDGSTHAWNIAPSGTAGNAISFTQAMTLDASGNLLVGTTSSNSGSNGLKVAGPVSFTGSNGFTGNYTVSASDTWLTGYSLTGTTTITLPTPSTNAGRFLFIRTQSNFAINSASSNVTTLAGGAVTTSILAATAGKWAILFCDGSYWNIFAAN